MRTLSRFISKNIGISLVSLLAWPLALTFSGSAVASDYACDGFVGNFAVGSGDEATLKIVKEGAGFTAMFEGDTPDDWERVPLKIGVPEDKEEEMLAEGGRMRKQLTCALWADGLFLFQLRPGSADNPSESDSRNSSQYPRKTPYLMVVRAGPAVGQAGLYRVAAQD